MEQIEKIPIFKKREIIVKLPKTESVFENTSEIQTEVLYVGKNAENYKVGDTIVFNKGVGKELKFLGENYWKIEHEDYIICQLS